MRVVVPAKPLLANQTEVVHKSSYSTGSSSFFQSRLLFTFQRCVFIVHAG